MNKRYEILSWDSDFFGFPVARISGDNLSASELHECLSELTPKVKLVYYAGVSKIIDESLLTAFNGLLVDEKTTLCKQTTNADAVDRSIVEYDDSFNLREVIELGIASGVYSRYKADLNIEAGKYETLYKEWVLNSINHSLAEKVMIYCVDHNVLGMITLGIKNSRADIGIVAVKASERGKGIGKALLKAATAFSSEKGLSAIQVVTQGANVPALALYHGAGYQIEKVEYFYHFWL